MADLKINGITYTGVEEVQIPLADGSANAVFVPESDSGVATNMMCGEFTPEADTDRVVITIPGSFTDFYFFRSTLSPATSTARNIYAAHVYDGTDILSIGSGSGGGAPAPSVTQFNSGYNASLTLNEDGTYTLITNVGRAGSGYITTDKYYWVAWDRVPLA